MTLRPFLNYRCLIALDPDEWPGEWETLIDQFPMLALKREVCFEFQRETKTIILGPDAQVMEEVIAFFDLLFSRQLAVPNGGIVFVAESGQIFKTNWELRECWDWQYVLQRAKSEELFLQCFAVTGAIVEFQHIGMDMQVQHLDYEHPSGVEGSRADLPGVTLRSVKVFSREVGAALDYLRSLSNLAERNGKSESFANVFGTPSASVA